MKNSIIARSGKTALKTAKAGCCIGLLCASAAMAADEKINGKAAAPFSYKVPTEIPNPANPLSAADFAWKEFIALTWPAAPNASQIAGTSPYVRGKADPGAAPGSTGADGTVVWETYYHRDELYPNYTNPNMLYTLPDANAMPNYQYGATTITGATPGTKLNLFANLDEASEINIAFMYFTPLAEKVDSLRAKYPNPTQAQQALIQQAAINSAIMYEAKGNSVIYNYVKENQFNNPAPRRKARVQAMNKINNLPVTGTAFELPAGSIEIKATWRHFNPDTDNLKDFHWTTGLYYTKQAGTSNLVANNDILVLVALHIIQKTPNVPTFTFATFEHVSNEKNGFRFTNANPQTDTSPSLPRALPDPGIIAAQRQFPVPQDIVAFNNQIQAALRAAYGNDVVWANYQLIGVQAIVADNPTSTVPAQQFFLSNFATETNDTLQFFQGGLSGPNTNVPNPDTAHVFTLNAQTKKYAGHTAGGCLGCHGSQGQFPGGDFSVIAATGNASFVPEPVTPYPSGPVVNQNPTGFPLKQ
ncbi:MAG TPA: hypothetical protein VIF60_01740 [Burkholderiaceae bacterium]|jgi:hypothetical protein